MPTPQDMAIAKTVRSHSALPDGNDPYADIPDDELAARWQAKYPANAPAETDSRAVGAIKGFLRSVGEDKGLMETGGGLLGSLVGAPGAGVAGGNALANIAAQGGSTPNQPVDPMGPVDIAEEAAIHGSVAGLLGMGASGISSGLKAIPALAEDSSIPASRVGVIRAGLQWGGNKLGNAIRSVEGLATTPIGGESPVTPSASISGLKRAAAPEAATLGNTTVNYAKAAGETLNPEDMVSESSAIRNYGKAAGQRVRPPLVDPSGNVVQSGPKVGSMSGTPANPSDLAKLKALANGPMRPKLTENELERLWTQR